jgi:D-alanyl-D-alanine dipeptidase
VDVTLAQDGISMAHGPALLDLGTGIDEFAAGDRLTITHEARLCREGGLSPVACANRRLLRAVMTEAGFTPYEGEWWHFSGCDKARFPAVQ